MTFNHGDNFMWLFDAHEYYGEIYVNYHHYYVAVMKVGGGTRGRRYDGSWLYTIVDTRNGQELSRGQLDSDVPMTHEEMAAVVNAHWRLGSDE